MCFHGNQLSWGIKHPLISLWSKYRSPAFIRFSTMLAPVISSLDEIYCTNIPGGASKKVKTEPKVDPEVAQALEKQSKMIWKIRDKLHRECRYVCHRVMFGIVALRVWNRCTFGIVQTLVLYCYTSPKLVFSSIFIILQITPCFLFIQCSGSERIVGLQQSMRCDGRKRGSRRLLWHDGIRRSQVG